MTIKASRDRLHPARDDYRSSERRRDRLRTRPGLARGSEHDPLAREPRNDSGGGDLGRHRQAGAVRMSRARSGGPRRATPPGDDARTRTSTRRNDPRTRPLALERKSRPTRSCRGWSLPRQPRESRRRTCPRPSGEEHADSALGNDRTWAWVWAATFQIHPMPRSTLLQCRCLPHRWAGSRAVADRSAGLASDRTIPRLRRRW